MLQRNYLTLFCTARDLKLSQSVAKS